MHPSTPRFTLEQVLNNADMPGRKAAPAISNDRNTDGFAAERLYSVPAPGSIGLKPGEVAVLVSSPDAADHEAGWESFEQMLGR